MNKKVLLILANGFEEIEALAPVDILRRAGVEVAIAGLSAREQASARGVRVICDTTLAEVLERGESFDVCLLPGGGKGAENLAAAQEVSELIVRMNKAGKIIAAICAAPAVVLTKTGVLDGKRATCFPGMQDRFSPRTEYCEEPVVEDGNVITSRGAGTAAVFGLALVDRLCGEAVRAKIARSMLFE